MELEEVELDISMKHKAKQAEALKAPEPIKVAVEAPKPVEKVEEKPKEKKEKKPKKNKAPKNPET